MKVVSHSRDHIYIAVEWKCLCENERKITVIYNDISEKLSVFTKSASVWLIQFIRHNKLFNKAT